MCPAYPANQPDFSQYRANEKLQNDFSEYMAVLREKIQRSWNPPDFMEDGHAVVMFRINRQGEVLAVNIIESSNNNVYDESTIEAIKKSSPFNKFPAYTAKDSLTIRYSFDTSYVKTDRMKEYVKKADTFFNVNNDTALSYINLAINEVQGDIGSYFLYGKRSKIKRALGDTEGARLDLEECRRLKAKFDQKRINSSKLIAEMEKTPFSYYYLAYSYDIAGDYEHALEAIDKAIALTELNNQYKRYKQELIAKKQGT